MERKLEFRRGTEKITYYKYEDSPVLYGEIAPGAELDLNDAINNETLRSTFLDPQQPIPYISNIQNIFKISKEAREYTALATSGISCVALVIDSGISRIISNYALLINKPHVPTKVFSTIGDAEDWVQSFIS